MIDRPAPRNTRVRAPLVPIVSLTVAVGLTASLGLAPTVWGGPPEEGDDILDVDPTADPVAADPAAPATDPSVFPAADDLPSAGVSVPGASSLRSKMEAGMAEIGELAVEARTDEDLVRATCVLDKQDRANDVMELGTSEFLIIRDPGTSEQARSFALEKLDAAATRVEVLVDEAKACAGRQGPEDEAGITRRESDEPTTVPMWDPSAGLGLAPTPPPLDGGWPPVASPIE